MSPPSVRLCCPWGGIGLFGTPRQTDRRPTGHTDVSSGFSISAYQAEEVGVDHAEGDRSVLFLVDGSCSEGRHASETSAQAQQGETGFCPRCAASAHVPAPVLFNGGADSAGKAMDMTIWQQRGP